MDDILLNSNNKKLKDEGLKLYENGQVLNERNDENHYYYKVIDDEDIVNSCVFEIVGGGVKCSCGSNMCKHILSCIYYENYNYQEIIPYSFKKNINDYIRSNQEIDFEIEQINVLVDKEWVTLKDCLAWKKELDNLIAYSIKIKSKGDEGKESAYYTLKKVLKVCVGIWDKVDYDYIRNSIVTNSIKELCSLMNNSREIFISELVEIVGEKEHVSILVEEILSKIK